MKVSQFAFLEREWAAVFDGRAKAEAAVHADPRTACFYARRALELAVSWAYKHDAGAEASLSGQPLGADPRAELQAGRRRGGVQQGAGDQHARQPRRAQPSRRARGGRAGGRARAVPRRLLARPHLRPRAGARHRASHSMPPRCRRPAPAPAQTPSSCRRWKRRLRERDEKLAALLADKTALDEELKRLRAEVAEAKQAAARAARHARLLRGRDPRLLHRPAAQGSGLAARPAARPRVRGQRHAQRQGQGLRRLRALGRRRQAAGAGGGQAHAARPAGRASSRRSSMPTAWSSSSASGRSSSTPTATSTGSGTTRATRRAAVQGFYKKAELELLIQRRETRQLAGGGADQPDDRRALLPDARHPPHRRGLRARPRPQGAARDGHGRRQDAHRHRAGRPADAVQLGQARAVPRRPRGAGEPGRERVQEASARRLARQPRHREGRRGARLRLDLPDHDGADRRDGATASGASASGTSTS